MTGATPTGPSDQGRNANTTPEAHVSPVGEYKDPFGEGTLPTTGPQDEKSSVSAAEQTPAKVPDVIHFGPEGDRPFSDLGEDLATILGEINAHSLEVRHTDGWDHVQLQLEKAMTYDVKPKVLEIVGTLSWSEKALVNFTRWAKLDNSISYSGKLLEDGSVVARDVKGLTIQTLIGLEVTPHEGTFHASGEAHLSKATTAVGTISKKFTLPAELADMARAAIVEFDKLRKGIA